MPGTGGEENWTLRAPHPLEAWRDVPALEETLARLVKIRREVKG